VLFPVASQEDTATYEVPFGFINRKFNAAELNYSQWGSNTLEFPALHWVNKRVDKKSGVALLNKGLPCNRWMPGRLDLSLLRSPEAAFCANEANYYDFWDLNGLRDTGRHRFEYSLWPYVGGLTEAKLTEAGYAYNLPEPLSLPFKVSGSVQVTAFKLAEDGQGWILRLQESSGKGTRLRIEFKGIKEIARTDLLERPLEKFRGLKSYEARLHRHGILTLKIR
jgi:alpha-mannosidase